MRISDPVLLLLLLALGLTLLLFMLDVFPYPFGIIILSALSIARWLAMQGKSKS